MSENKEMGVSRNLCWECRDVCQDVLYNHILIHGGDRVNSNNIRLLADCIQICQISADFMRRNSEHRTSICAACADICEACADSCEHMGKEHAQIQRCAEICRRCSESCRKVCN